jgi:alpha-ketoglutarate-dependent taurine dioxygenase
MESELAVEPLAATFGAKVRGLSLADLDEESFRPLYRLWLEHGLLIFPDQFLGRDEQVEFARRFGALEFDWAELSNVRRDGSLRADSPLDDVMQILKGNMGWHADSTYMPVQAKGAVFTAHEVPSQGGETGWADMSAAYEALDESTRARVQGLSAFHSLYYSQLKLGYQPQTADAEQTPRDADGYSGYGFHGQDPPLRPLVKTHPETGRKSLLIGRHAYGIPGLAPEESDALLQELIDFACQPPRVYHHAWQAGEAVVWDNRRLLHRGRPWDMSEPRVMCHSRIAGDQESEFAAPA